MSESNGRKSANFDPSVWGDHFLVYASNSLIMETDEEHKKLKDEVEKMLNEVSYDERLLNKLELIDTIQRLGVSYHFQTTIDQLFEQIYKPDALEVTYNNNNNINDDDLHIVSLYFRLVRQQEYKISPDIFNKFKDDKGGFKNTIVCDVRGMLSLYEATHLMFHGEDILEEALVFTTTHLKCVATSNVTNPQLVEQVAHALKQPILKSIPRVETRYFIDTTYQHDISRNKNLLLFAKLDFNILQKMHQKELNDISRWWKDLNFANKLHFARNRMIEGYFWALGICVDPRYIFCRRILTKMIALISIIDDIYDVYGTLEELELFKDAIEMCDVNVVERLPEYLKFTYHALLEVYAEIEEKLAEEGNLYRLHYIKQAMKVQVNSYFVEAKWFHSQYQPTFEEYIPNAITSSASSLLIIVILIGMEGFIEKKNIEWILNHPKILRGSEIIGRLMNDIVSHKFEQERGHVASSVECYMKTYNSTEKEAIEELRKQVADAWKDINEECLQPTEVPTLVLVTVLNFIRVVHYMYKSKDCYTHGGILLKDVIASILIDPVLI